MSAALVLTLAGVLSTSAIAGVTKLGDTARERMSRTDAMQNAVDLYYRAAQAMAPGITEPLIDYSKLNLETRCDAQHTPQTYAVLIGADQIGVGGLVLEGPQNDVDLIAAQLQQAGAKLTNLRLLTQDNAKRDGVKDAFLDVLGKVQCNDSVVVHFSGQTAMAARIAAELPQLGTANQFRGEWEKINPTVPFETIQNGLYSQKIEIPADRYFFVSIVFAGDAGDLALLLNSDSADHLELVLGSDISDYMVAVRNLGASAAIVLDGSLAAASNIHEKQREGGRERIWNFKYEEPAREEYDIKRNGLELVPGHGEFAVFYASGEDEVTPELAGLGKSTDERKYGLFSFAFANALVNEQSRVTPRGIASTIQAAYAGRNRVKPHPRIETSNPELVLVPEARTDTDTQVAIRILKPSPKRGADKVEDEEIVIEGIVEWPSPTLGVFFDQQEVKVYETGVFKGKIKLKSGLNRINILALTADERIHSHVLELVYEGDLAALEGSGRRIALLIANQNYDPSTSFSSLSTPFADAEAISKVLTTKYGFETEILGVNNAHVPLMLKDPTREDILIALNHLERVLNENDTLLLYYAGHGVFDERTSTAYWVPSDGTFFGRYVSANDISASLQRLNAKNVILISDSCYSGALLRGGPAEAPIADTQRVQALLSLRSKRSRVLITSGNNEPVEDLGGRGHSVFARAFLTGLERMEHDAFSARELFDNYVLHAVTANSDQEPQYRPLEKVGHEGGDFVFVRR